MPPNSLIIGVDLSPIKAIPRCITFQSDITTDKCRATIRQHLKTLKADTVLHDGAPNVGTAWVQDAFSQAELVLQSLRLATDFLAPGGSFITKIFRSKDYNSLLWVFNQLFGKVEATKPPSSRNVSAEIFVVCRDFKAPKRIDPRFLDAKTVFAELTDPTPNNEAKVFNPEVKKRKREGYTEGDWTQFKEVPVSEFIQTTDPIAMLGSSNKLSFDQKPNGDLALAALDRLPETTEEVRNCCADLKVLGRKDFKLLLRWRLKVREKFGFAKKKTSQPEESEEVAEVEPMDEEMQIQEEMQRVKDLSDTKKKKEKRKDNERKRKEIVRMQMSMTTPSEIGVDQASIYGEDSMFVLKNVDKTDAPEKFVKGKMHSIAPKPADEDVVMSEESSDDEADNLEGQLDSMYEDFQERKKAADAKYRAKRARKEHEDFEGFSEGEGEEPSSEEDVQQNEDSESDDEEETSGPSFDARRPGKMSAKELSSRAAMFFDQDIFKGIEVLGGEEPVDKSVHSDSGIDVGDSSDVDSDDASQAKPSDKQEKAQTRTTKTAPPNRSKLSAPTKTVQPTTDGADNDDTTSFEVVKARPETSAWTSSDPTTEPTTKDGRPDIDIITAEAMTLAHSLATGRTSKNTLIDDAFNRYSLRDVEGLPDWFLDDENSHSKLQRPTTAAAAAAIKEKLRALNARPIKKVREAKARKKMRAATRLEKLKKKSALLVEDGDLSERDKASKVQELMRRAKRGGKPRKEVKVVVARGGNRGISGRPKGTKGKYKMVDARMKKETRALKRVAKKKK